MSRLAAFLFLAMGVVWFAAACMTGAATWLRWPVLATTVLALGLARVVHGTRVALPALGVPLALLGVYGLCLSAFSPMSTLAFAKCVAWVAGVSACLLGGALWVERWGRDAVFRWWGRAWVVLLVVAVAGNVLGRWESGPEGLYGFTGNPNQFASLVGSLGLVLFATARTKSLRTAILALVALALVLSTRSRTTIAAVGAAMVAAVAVGRGWKKWTLAAAPLLVASMALMFLPEQSLAQVRSVADTETLDDLFRTREENWIDSWSALKAGLPLGFGWGVKANPARAAWSWDVRSWGYGREEGTSWLPIGEELGLPGIVLFAWIWIVIVRAAYAAYPQPIAVAGIAFFFVMATFEGWLLSPGNWESFSFWTFVGIVLVRPRPGTAPVPAQPLPAQPLPRPAVALEGVS